MKCTTSAISTINLTIGNSGLAQQSTLTGTLKATIGQSQKVCNCKFHRKVDSKENEMTSTKRKIWQEGYDAHSFCTVDECPYNVVTQTVEWDTWMDGFDYADATEEK
jgi:predicted ATPase